MLYCVGRVPCVLAMCCELSVAGRHIEHSPLFHTAKVYYGPPSSVSRA